MRDVDGVNSKCQGKWTGIVMRRLEARVMKRVKVWEGAFVVMCTRRDVFFCVVGEGWGIGLDQVILET